MPIYTVQAPDGSVYDIEGPEGATAEQLGAFISQQAQATPKSNAERFVKGLRDPIDGGAQLLTKSLPDSVVSAGNEFNNWLADKTGLVGRLPHGGVDQQVKEAEREFQTSGIDWPRLAGNVLSPANLALASVTPATVTGGAAMGGFSSLTAPEASDNYLQSKVQKTGLGVAGGMVAPWMMGGVARVVSPKASTDPAVRMLKNEGVEMSAGQAAGGFANRLEERLTSVPLLGDAISAARMRGRETFNQAAINRALAPLGEKTDDIGQVGVKAAGDKISKVYDEAINSVKVVKYDPKFAADYRELFAMTRNLVPEMRKKFDDKVESIFGSRMSPRGSMFGETYKKVDSDIGDLARRYQGSNSAAEQELGDALAQFQNLMKQQAMRSNPKAAELFKKADEAWANLVRVEGASKSAKNAEGVFTPAQLNMSIQQADDSVRGRSVSRGTALMQDLGNAGQKVLGSNVPNSGTPERLMAAMMGAGAFYDPMAAGITLGTGLAAYSNPGQKFLNFMLTQRPSFAEPVADGIRQATPFLVPAASFGLLNQ